MLLSIVIPCYNAEKYIKNCIDKVLSINVEKEIIVINDGSTDNSLRILQNYNNRIKLLNFDKNLGVCHARNVGLKFAKGQYIGFIDIDDDFDIEMFPKMLKAILSSKADLAFCNLDFIKPNGKVMRSKYSIDFGILDKKASICEYLMDKIYPSQCICLYNSSIIKKTKFSENIDTVGADINFVLKCLLLSEKVIFIDEPLYHYIQRDSSIMHSLSDRLVCGHLDVINTLDKKDYDYLSTNFPDEFEYFKLEMIQRAVNAVSLISNKKNKKQAALLIKKCCDKNVCKRIINNRFSPKYIKIEFFIIKIFGVRFHLFIFPLYNFIRTSIRHN